MNEAGRRPNCIRRLCDVRRRRIAIYTVGNPRDRAMSGSTFPKFAQDFQQFNSAYNISPPKAFSILVISDLGAEHQPASRCATAVCPRLRDQPLRLRPKRPTLQRTSLVADLIGHPPFPMVMRRLCGAPLMLHYGYRRGATNHPNI